MLNLCKLKKKRGLEFQVLISIIIALILTGVFALIIIGMKKGFFKPG